MTFTLRPSRGTAPAIRGRGSPTETISALIETAPFAVQVFHVCCGPIDRDLEAAAIDPTGIDFKVGERDKRFFLRRDDVEMRRGVIARIHLDEQLSEASQRWHVVLTVVGGR